MMIDVVSCFVGGRKPLCTPIPARFVHVVSVQYRLVTDGRTDGHITTAYTALT